MTVPTNLFCEEKSTKHHTCTRGHGPMRTNRTNPRKNAFLAAYLATGGNISRASHAARVDRTRHYAWLKTDAAYAEVFMQKRFQASEMLEDEATRRAFEGVDKPVYHNGVVVGTVKEYSTTLMLFLLRAQKPDKYRD